MATKKLVKETDEKIEKATDTYTKSQLALSKRYEDKKDIINVILEDGIQYTIEKADELINKFMERKVK